jgi:enoyl-CoA hydratase/carnithine racemase
MSTGVVLEISASVAFVTLSNPAKFNAMTRSMWRELRAVFEGLQNNTAIRCVVLRGTNGNFCSGGDISEYADFRFQELTLRDFHENDVWGGLQAMLDCDAPIVAQIEGNCMGAGVEIACCCDIRIADDSAQFGAPIARLGFPMAPREAALVTREAGALLAREMLLEAAVCSAGQMLTRGFLNRVVPEGKSAGEARATATRITALAPQAARMNKQTLRALNQPAASSMTSFGQAYAYAASTEHREGVEAFVGKRKANF